MEKQRLSEKQERLLGDLENFTTEDDESQVLFIVPPKRGVFTSGSGILGKSFVITEWLSKLSKCREKSIRLFTFSERQAQDFLLETKNKSLGRRVLISESSEHLEYKDTPILYFHKLEFGKPCEFSPESLFIFLDPLYNWS